MDWAWVVRCLVEAEKFDRAGFVAGCRRLLVKVGGGVLTSRSDVLNAGRIYTLVEELVSLKQADMELILVSSGAILAGARKLGLPQKPATIPLQQAAAAAGQATLMWEYESAFGRFGQKVAQVLITQPDFVDRRRFINARNALQQLLKLDVVPIVNENDTVVVDEIKFGDNDSLAADVANLMSFDLLIILSDVDGIYDADPRRHPDAGLISIVTPKQRLDIDFSERPSTTGRGGVASKVMAARKAAASGIATVILNGTRPGAMSGFLAGETLGTLFVPQEDHLTSRKHWIGFILPSRGVLTVDAGARRAVMEGGKSLLPSGIVGVEGRFDVGDCVSCRLGGEKKPFARGLANYDNDDVRRIMGRRSSEIETILGYKYHDEVVHRDDLVLAEGLS